MIHVAKIKSREFVFRKGVILAASPIKILTDQRNEGKLDKKREKKVTSVLNLVLKIKRDSSVHEVSVKLVLDIVY